MKYVIHIGDNTMRKWKTYVKFMTVEIVYIGYRGIRGTAEIWAETITFIPPTWWRLMYIMCTISYVKKHTVQTNKESEWYMYIIVTGLVK